MPAVATPAPLPLGLVKDIFPGAGLGNVNSLVTMDGTLFFIANNGVSGSELWKSDGTAPGTVLVKDIVGGAGGASFRLPLTVSNHVLYFGASNGVNGSELWRSDGTASGTRLVKDIWPGVGNASPGGFTDIGGTLFFTAGDPIYGTQLWKTDGTTAGTVRVNDINTQHFTTAPFDLINVNGTLFFAAATADTNGAQLWKSDGSAAGTMMVKEINPEVAAIGGPGDAGLLATSGGLYFVARTPEAGLELWKSDGTEAGTVMVSDINPGPGDANPGHVTKVNGEIFFTATDGTHGNELWVTDGTDAGTQMVLDINPGSSDSAPVNLVALNNKLYFAADDGVHGRELWSSDGTAAGTTLVMDIWPGASASTPNYLTSLNGLLYFSAWDGTHGHELWQSDGTLTGTSIVADIMPGGNGSYPERLTVLDGALFFTANDGTHGYELWKLGSISRQKPVITGLTSDQLVAVGDAVSFTVSATAAPGPTYLWLKNGAAIPGATLATYSIPVAGLGDGATYSVRVSNASGIATGTVRLGVLDTQPSTVGVNNLATAMLQLGASGPGLSYQWHASAGGNVANAGRFRGALTSRLSITRFTSTDEGSSYTCTVSLGSLHIDSGTFAPMVRSKPEIEAAASGVPIWNVSGHVTSAITDLIDLLNAGAPNYPSKFTITGLPAGVTYNSATGQISGIPAIAGDYHLGITAVNAAGSSTTIGATVTVYALPWTTHGTYNGLIGSLGSAISVQVQTTGTFTGSIWVNGIKTSFAGRLDATSGDPTVSGLRVMLHESGGVVYPVTLSFTISISSGRLEGTMKDDRGFSYEVTARPNLWGANNPARNYAGYYTAAIQPDPGALKDIALPQGNGFLTISVTTAGLVGIGGHLADGSAITASTTLGPFGQMPLSNSFLNAAEVVQGWVQISYSGDPSLNTVGNLGSFLWFRSQPGARDPAFPTQSLTVIGGMWVRPDKGNLILNAPDVDAGSYNAYLAFTGANVEASAVNNGIFSPSLRLTTAGTATFPGGSPANPAGVTFTVNLATGVFSGSFTLKDPNPLKPVQMIIRTCNYYGVIVPNQNSGLGYFRLGQLPAAPGDTSVNTPVYSGAVVLQSL